MKACGVGVEWDSGRVGEAKKNSPATFDVFFFQGNFLDRDIVDIYMSNSNLFWVCSYCFDGDMSRSLLCTIVDLAPQNAIIVTLHPFRVAGLRPLFTFPALPCYFDWLGHKRDQYSVMSEATVECKDIHVYERDVLFGHTSRTLTRRENKSALK